MCRYPASSAYRVAVYASSPVICQVPKPIIGMVTSEAIRTSGYPLVMSLILHAPPPAGIRRRGPGRGPAPGPAPSGRLVQPGDQPPAQAPGVDSGRGDQVERRTAAVPDQAEQ